jgi:hypothetical protein
MKSPLLIFESRCLPCWNSMDDLYLWTQYFEVSFCKTVRVCDIFLCRLSYCLWNCINIFNSELLNHVCSWVFM